VERYGEYEVSLGSSLFRHPVAANPRTSPSLGTLEMITGQM